MAQAGDRLNRATPRWSPRQVARQALVACLPSSRLVERFPGTGAVYLTFDDGPHPEHTPRVLDVLRQHDARATFFVVGRECERYPEIVRRIVDEGHTLGNHTHTHVDARQVSLGDYQRDIRQADETIRSIVGIESAWFRPPYGRLTVVSMAMLAYNRRTIVLWNVDVRDYAAVDHEEIRGWLQENPVCGGDIVLLHDSRPHGIEILPDLIDAAAKAGFALRGLGEQHLHRHVQQVQ